MSRFREPVIFLLAGLILLLVPAAIGLIVLYDDQQEQRALELVPLPSEAILLEHVRTFDAGLGIPRLTRLYQAHPLPRSGLLAVYGVYDQERLVYHLALVRLDGSCSTCGESKGAALAGVFLNPDKRQVQGVVSLSGGAGAKVALDPALILAQVQGHPVLDSLARGTR